MPLSRHLDSSFIWDVSIRLLLFCIYAVFQIAPPFKRVVHPQEVWMYKNPVTESYCPMNILWEIVIVVPPAAIFINYLIHKDKSDVVQAFLSYTLIVSLNGAVTNMLKVVVGRPRPDFYFRCFPNGEGGNEELKGCTGNIDVINDGLKSFPSGHSSIAFASLGFLSLYLAAKMHLFTPSGKGTTWKVLLFVLPLLVATTIAISRTCDYHHHWQDVLSGSILGIAICWLCYHNYYPSLYMEKCHIPWISLNSRRWSEHLTVKDV